MATFNPYTQTGTFTAEDLQTNGKLLITNTTLSQVQPNYNICFHKDGKEVGKLDFNSGTLKFEGNADESAMRFVEYLSAQWSTRLHREQAEAMRLLAELVTFELADEVELDDAYRKGFNDAMQACRAMFLKKAEEKEGRV